MSDWTREQMLEFLGEFEALTDIVWSKEAVPEKEARKLGAEAYLGTIGPWRATVVSFNIEPQGFPKGSRGYDGAVNNYKRGVVCRMTREIAERVFKAAAATVGA